VHDGVFDLLHIEGFKSVISLHWFITALFPTSGFCRHTLFIIVIILFLFYQGRKIQAGKWRCCGKF